MGLREFNLTSIIPGVNAWASEKGRTILLDETTTNQNCSRLFPQGLKEVLHRSEEHTSELQSQSNLVCRLLLEKKFKPKFVKEVALRPNFKFERLNLQFDKKRSVSLKYFCKKGLKWQMRKAKSSQTTSVLTHFV